MCQKRFFGINNSIFVFNYLEGKCNLLLTFFYYNHDQIFFKKTKVELINYSELFFLMNLFGIKKITYCKSACYFVETQG